MTGITSAVVLAAMMFSISACADTLDLGEGLAVEAASAANLKFGAIPSYDASKKMLSRWSGQRLQYFISVNRLPRSRRDADQYFERLINDLYATHGDGNVEIFDQGKYDSPGGFAGAYVAFRLKPYGSEKSQQQITHFLRASRFSYVATGVLVSESAGTQMHDDTISLFKTASQAPRR